MSASCSSFKSKHWITTATVNSIKSKSNIYKTFGKKKKKPTAKGNLWKKVGYLEKPSYDVTKNHKG